jgi:hypothetical protein
MSDKIYEGLILTHDLNIITNIISKKYKAIFYYDKNIFKISHKFDDKLFNIEINEIIQLTDNLGWFPSQIIYDVNENQKYLKFSLTNFLNLIKLKIYDMNIFFEAKYDIDIYPIPEKMYHVTNLRYLEKIKRYGLIPHKHEKLTSHPERIYLTNSIDESWIFIRALIFRTPENEREPLIILEIDTLFMKDRLRIMRDPNFQRGGIYTGFYTLNPIDPQCLSVIDIIYPNDLKNL